MNWKSAKGARLLDWRPEKSGEGTDVWVSSVWSWRDGGSPNVTTDNWFVGNCVISGIDSSVIIYRDKDNC